MSISPFSGAEEQEYRFLYLPAIAFGILLVESSVENTLYISAFNTKINIYLAGLTIGLLTAATLQEFVKSYTGPSTGSPTPVSRGHQYQRIAYTLFASGNPTKYPKNHRSPIWEVDVEIPKHRYLLFIWVFFSFGFLTIAYLYTLYTLSWFALAESSLLIGAVSFVQATAAVRFVAGTLWPNTYLRYEYSNPSLYQRVEEFGVYLRHVDFVDPYDVTFETENGGYIRFWCNSIKNSDGEIREAVEYLIYGYTAIIVPDSFPCQRLSVVVQQENGEQVEYELKTQSVDEFREGEKSMARLVEEMIASRSHFEK